MMPRPDGWPTYCGSCPNWDAERERCDVFLSHEPSTNPPEPRRPLMRDGMCRAYQWRPELLGAYAQGRQRATT